MKNLTFILLALVLSFTTACKKVNLTKKMNNSSWQVKQISFNSEEVTDLVLKSEIIYNNIQYSEKGNKVKFFNPNRESVELEEAGQWTLEKIVPTVGDKYFIIKNELEYSYERRKVFNVNEYGSQVILTEDNKLTQTIGDYTITYEKLN